MGAKRSLEIATSLSLIAGQMFAAGNRPLARHMPEKSSHHVLNEKLAPRAMRTGAPDDAYFAVSYSGAEETDRPKTLASSVGFDPDLKGTSASHVKLLTALITFEHMDRDPGFRDELDPEIKTDQRKPVTNWELLRRTLINSDCDAAQRLARKIAPEHTDHAVTVMLNTRAKALGVSKDFYAANASGSPDYPKRGGRQDSFSTPNDEFKIARELALKHAPKLKELAQSVGEVPTDWPTNNFFYPLRNRQDPSDGIIEICKTGTDRLQRSSTLNIIIVPATEKTPSLVILVYRRHPTTDPRPPIAVAAKMAKEAITSAGVTDQRFIARIEETAEGTLGRRDVGQAAGFFLRDKAHVGSALVERAGMHRPKKPHPARVSLASLLTEVH